MHLCGMDYKYFSPHFCGCNSFGCTGAIRCGSACHGPHSYSVYSGIEHSQFDSPRLVKHEAGFPNPRWVLIGSNQLRRIYESQYYRELLSFITCYNQTHMYSFYSGECYLSFHYLNFSNSVADGHWSIWLALLQHDLVLNPSSRGTQRFVPGRATEPHALGWYLLQVLCDYTASTSGVIMTCGPFY